MSDEAAPPAGKGRRLVMSILATVAATLAVNVALQVDDWGRDLTTNHARTAEGAADPALRPIHEPTRSADELAQLVRDVAGELRGWEVTGAEREHGGKLLTLRLVRTTRLFRFQDDVVVTIRDGGGERLLEAESRSRVGKGDLGQNPRNLKELLGRVRSKM